MGIKAFFRKAVKNPAKTLDQVDRMFTRDIALSEDKKNPFSVQFVAERDDSGHWKVFDITRGSLIRQKTDLFNWHTKAIRNAFTKHLGRSGKDSEMNFDEAYLILRELEESYLSYKNLAPGKEPFDHYAQAYRLLPPQFQSSLDDLYLTRNGKETPDAAPAPNPRSWPKPE